MSIVEYTQLDRWPRRLAASALAAALTMAATLPTAGASSTDSSGPQINRTLRGGIARDLSPQELRLVNRARGLAVR